MDKVSVIIPTFNRFKYLLNAIESVKKQIYKNIEIIVVNDCSSDKEYYSYDFGKDVIVIHLEKNSKNMFGYACAGYVRNQGIKVSSGNYVAFLDDDDVWFPNKIELQIKRISETGCKMSSTDGLTGHGIFNETRSYKKFNAESAFDYINYLYHSNGKGNLIKNGLPDIWNLEFIKINNCIICSSVLIEKCILDKIGNMNHLINGREDYDCWLRALEHTNCVYLKDICFYYDAGHGDGQHY
jgi:glycosyltransferase involved in cell wall biosynthesis